MYLTTERYIPEKCRTTDKNKNTQKKNERMNKSIDE